MSNLGPYLEIVNAASNAGGVEQLIASIRADAVRSYLPATVGCGIVIGTVAGAALTLLGLRFLAVHREALAAEESLRGLVEDARDDIAEDPTDRA